MKSNKFVTVVSVIGLIAAILAVVGSGIAYKVVSTESEQAVTWEVMEDGDLEARSYGCAVYTEQGCAKYVVASGGEIEIQSGGTFDAQSGATVNLNTTIASTGTMTVNALVVTTTSSLGGNISSATDAVTITDNVLVDAQTDVIALVVQGYTTPTTSLFVVEQADGTDVWNTNSSGQNSSANGAVSFIDDVIVDGVEDTDQLTVQGYTTQTNDLQVWEQSNGTDVATLTNAGALDIASTFNYGTGNLYPLGYASVSQEIQCGVTATFTDTTSVTASALTTVTYAIAIQVTDPVSTAVFLTVDTPSGQTFSLDSWEADYTVGTTGITAYWCAIGDL